MSLVRILFRLASLQRMYTEDESEILPGNLGESIIYNDIPVLWGIIP